MLCFDDTHQGIAALRETIEFLEKDAEKSYAALETAREMNELLRDQLQEAQEDKRRLMDALLGHEVANAPVPRVGEPEMTLPYDRNDPVPTIHGNIRDFLSAANLEEAKSYAQFTRNAAVDAVKE